LDLRAELGFDGLVLTFEQESLMWLWQAGKKSEACAFSAGRGLWAVEGALLVVLLANPARAQEAADERAAEDTQKTAAPEKAKEESPLVQPAPAQETATVPASAAKPPTSIPAVPVVESPPAQTSIPTTLSGMAQFRHHSMVDGQGNLQESGFALARSRVDLGGSLGQDFAYQISAAADNGRPGLFTAFVEYTPLRFLSLRAGQMRVPFSRAAVTPEELLIFPERAVATQEFAYLRDLGVSARAHSPGNRLEFIAAAFDGNGPNQANDNLDPMLLFRLAGAPIGRAWQPAEGDPQKSQHLGLMLGGTMTMDYVPAPTAYGYLSGSAVPPRPITNRDLDQDGHIDDVRVLQLAADLALRFRGLAFECELYQRKENWKQIPNQPGVAPLVVQNSFRAWFGQLSYFILPSRLQVAARASVTRVSPLTLGGRTRPETTCAFPDASTAPCRLPYADVRSELAGLVAYHIAGLRLSGTFARFRWSSDGSTQPPAAIENQFTLQTQWSM
jgi:hypothetical protein